MKNKGYIIKYMDWFFLLISVLFLNLNCTNQKARLSAKSEAARQAYKTGVNFVYKLYYSEALQAYKKAMQLDSTFAMAALRISQVYGVLQNTDSSDYYMQKAQKLYSYCTTLENLLIQQEYAYHQRHYEKADSILNILIKKYPGNFTVKMNLANRYWRRGNYAKARNIYQELLKQRPDYIVAYNNIGYLYAQQGYFKEAIKYIKKYQQLAPDQLNPYDSLADMYIYIGRYRQAISIIENLIEKYPERLLEKEFIGSIIYVKLASAYTNLGQYNKALTITAQARQNYTTNVAKNRLTAFRFRTCYELEQPEKIAQEYAAFTQFNNDIDSLHYKILLDIRQNKLDTAQNNLDLISQKIQSISDNKYKMEMLGFLNHLQGEINYSKGLYKEAARDYARTMKIYQGDVTAISLRLKHHLAQGKSGETREAIAGLKKLLNINPNYAKALVAISEFYLLTQQDLKANFYLDHFFKFWENKDQNTPLSQKAIILRNKLSL